MNIKEKLQKEIEKECFDEFGFNKFNDVKWVIKKSVELTMNETLKNPKIHGLIEIDKVIYFIDEEIKDHFADNIILKKFNKLKDKVLKLNSDR